MNDLRSRKQFFSRVPSVEQPDSTAKLLLARVAAPAPPPPYQGRAWWQAVPTPTENVVAPVAPNRITRPVQPLPYQGNARFAKVPRPIETIDFPPFQIKVVRGADPPPFPGNTTKSRLGYDNFPVPPPTPLKFHPGRKADLVNRMPIPFRGRAFTVPPRPPVQDSKQADSLRFHLTGAVTDGGAQADPDLSLGNYRSSTEAERVGRLFFSPIPGISIRQASRQNGAQGTIGSLFATHLDRIAYAAPNDTRGPSIQILPGQTKTIYSNDGSKWVRAERTSSSSLSGFGQIEFVDMFNNVFGMANAPEAESAAGSDKYRAVMLVNVINQALGNIKLYLGTLASQAVSSAGLPSSGAGTIVGATDAFCGKPFKGWARVSNSGGSLKEIVYYSSRTDETLTVPSEGRGRLGTSATAGAATDLIDFVPGLRIGFEPASPPVAGPIQTIADEDTAPTGITWSTGITPATGVQVGNLDQEQQGGIWIHRELPVEVAGIAEVLNLIKVQFELEGTTYTETLAGLYRIADEDLERWELWVGTGAEPDLNDPPDEIFDTSPTDTTLQLTDDETNYVTVGKRNKYDMISHAASIVIRLEGGVEVDREPSAPQVLSWEAFTGGTGLAEIIYLYLNDGEFAGDEYHIWLTSDGSEPDPLDTPTAEEAIPKVDGMGWLSWVSDAFAHGTTLKLLVRTYRAADGVYSTNTDVHTITADTQGPSAPDGLVAHWRKRAQG